MVFEAFILGLSTGTYCASSCAPVAIPFVLSEDADARRNALNLSLFLLGRLLGYLAVGALLGALGSYALGYVDPVLQRSLGSAAWLVIGIAMTASGLVYNFPRLKLCEILGKILRPGRTALLYGLLTGLNLCPPFFAAAGRVFGAGGDALSGALFFLLFFLGTSIYFTPLFAVPLFRSRMGTVRMVSRISLILLGLYFAIFRGLLGLAFGG